MYYVLYVLFDVQFTFVDQIDNVVVTMLRYSMSVHDRFHLTY